MSHDPLITKMLSRPLDRNEIRSFLIAAGKKVASGLRERDALIREGDKAGISKTELAELAGVSRQTVYDILAREDSK
jgi:predicted DNA-binding protein (UPF0251 family)